MAKEQVEEVEEIPTPRHPTLIYPVDLPLDMSAELDTATNYVVLNHRLSGLELPLPGALTPEIYLERSIQAADREVWRQSIISRLPTKTKADGSSINISIPVFKSKRAQRIFGGSDIGLTVSGNIRVDGSMRTEKKQTLQRDNPNPTSYQFKFDQSQQFMIKGSVGEKVSVEIDQDSERLFEFENSLKLHYKGDDDEILKTVEAGNVSLSLGGAKLASTSARHKGLFGFKTESQLGALKLTTITSIQKGEKQEIKLEGGARTGRPVTIDPNEYVQWRYFFLDTLYRDAYRYRTDGLESIGLPGELQMRDIDVYISVTGVSENRNEVFGWAFHDPRESVDIDTLDPDAEHQRANFLPLVQDSDYEVNKQLGYIRLNRPVDVGTIVAVAYSTDSDTLGDLDPSDNLDSLSAPFILKLLKPNSPQPKDLTWNLMWRNVYDLRAANITREGFEGRITLSAGQTGEREDSGLDLDLDQIRSFIEIFGLDHFGNEGRPDGRIDEVFINFARGELIFPDLQPFAPVGWFKGGVPQKAALDTSLFTDTLYTSSRQVLNRVSSQFEIEVSYTNISATYDLGYNVLEGSVEVIMNGARLSPGIDYAIDYVTGELTILRSEALTPGTGIEIKYETGAMFQLDTKTLLGMRAEYELWEDSFIGTTMLYMNQKTLDKRIRVGSEPTRNTIWDVNARLQFEPMFLTRAVDWLPLIETDEASQLTIEAEVAQVFPDPNSLNSPSTGDHNGVAYIDDFETNKRAFPLGITRRQWTAASFPDYDDRGEGEWLEQRGRLIWYNPWDQVKITDIWPEREVQAQASTTPVLRLEFKPWWAEWADTSRPAEGIAPEKRWGGIMRCLGAGYADQSQSKYLEIWLNRGRTTRGVMYIDLGQISEDVIPNRVLDTEDRPDPGFRSGNGILDNSEDTGIDIQAGADPGDMVDINGDGILLPSYDDWGYDRSNRNDYSRINGTEENKNDEGGHYPDSEDLDNNGDVDRTNDFYRYRIDLSEGDANRYIVGGLGNPKGWRLYRIPLKDVQETGNPQITSIEYARIWFTGFDRRSWLNDRSWVEIAQIEMVGNEWQEVEVSDGRGGTYDPISVAVVNTHDNPEYTPPPGVSGEVDPVTRLRAKEQSLVLRINRLGTGQTGLVHKQIPQQMRMSLIEYRKLKMFVHGGGPGGRLVDRFGRELDLEMFLSFGADTLTGRQRYYEFSQRLSPGWSGENEIVIDFDRLASLKFMRQQDSLRDYDILPGGDVIRIVGEPSLREIKFFSIGIKNHGSPVTEQDAVEIWVDELRVSDIQRAPGWAATGSADLRVAGNLLTVHADITQQQADFHKVDRRVGSDQDQLSGRFNTSFQFDQLFNPQWGIRIPFNANLRQSIDIPKYQPNSDVELSALTGERIDIWSIFLENLRSNNRYTSQPRYVSPVDSQITTSKQYSFSLGISKDKRSSNPLVRYALDRIRLNGSYSEDYSSNSNYMYDKGRQTQGRAGYDLSFDKPLELSWLWWARNLPLLGKLSESKFRPLPTSISTGVEGTESEGSKETRSGLHTDDYRLNLSRNYRVGWRPVTSLGFDFSQSVNSSRIVSDSARADMAGRLLNIDDYYIETEDTAYFDSTGWEEATRRQKEELFWRIFGNYFVDTDFSQSFSTNFNPVLMSWLGTDANYNARYRWNWRTDGYSRGGRVVGVNSSLSTSLTLRLPQIVGALIGKKRPPGAIRTEEEPPPWVKPEGGSGASSEPDSGMLPPDSGTGHGDESTLPKGTEPDTTGAPEKKPRRPPPDPLTPFKELLRRLRDVRWDFSQTDDISNPAVGSGQAGWRYRLGLTSDPGMERVSGFIYSDSYARRREHSFRSGLDITPNIAFTSLHYSTGQTKTEDIQSQTGSSDQRGSNTRTVFQMFRSNGTSIRAVPVVNWNFRWSGWERLSFLKELANSVSLDNSFQGSATESWRKSSADSASETTRIEYDKSFSPLMGVSIAWKGGVGTSVRYNLSQRVFDERLGNETKSRDLTRTVSISSSYTSRKGFRIPIPVWPFRNRRLKNTTSFSLTYDNSFTKSENSAGGEKFSTSNETSSWSVRPSIEYTFSTTVRGGFHYEYAVQKSDRTGETKSQDFGFSVNISIRG